MDFDRDARREYQVEADIDEEIQYERLARELGYENGDEMKAAQDEQTEQDREYYSALGVSGGI